MNGPLSTAIFPHLWFDNEAKAAAEFYCTVFPDSEVISAVTLTNTPSGNCDVVTFNVRGYPFQAISAGPLFIINPSISFIVNFDPARDKGAMETLERVWDKLSDGGTALMPLDRYPFSERYGWIQDKFGVSWQLMLAEASDEPAPSIVPSLMFVGANCGKAEEAREFYLSVFRNSKPGALFKYGPGQAENPEGTVMFTDFMLERTWFAAIDSAYEHGFQFNEAISFVILCESQEDIDYYWDKLSAVPEAEQCGWLKDKYGLSWQVVPAAMDEMMAKGTREQIDRVTKAFLPMRKFDLARLQRAFEGE